jgi:general secretion pathway protein D
MKFAYPKAAQERAKGRLPAWVCAALLLASASVSAQQATITPNYKDADLAQIVDAVSAITGKNFIIDPRVRAQVTMLSSTPMSPDAFYEAFLSILQVHGFTAVETGNIVRVIPMANARTSPSVDLPDRVSSTSDELVTQVITVRNISAVQLVPILRPLIPQEGHLVASPSSNVLIISDRANNVNRIMRIIARIDQAGDGDIDIIQLQNASSGEIVRVINTLFAAGGAAAEGGGGAMQVKVVADDRSNSVLVTGEASQRLRIKTLITHLDTPLESGGDTQVRYLHYADAEKIATKLKEQVQGVTQAAPGGAAAAGAAAADRNVTIWADVETNALVITAPPKMMRQVMSIIDKLDIRRAQVQVEAIVVEIDSEKASEFGLNWAATGNDSAGNPIPLGVFNQAVGGTSLGDILRGIANPSTATAVPTGLTLGGGRFDQAGGGMNFAVILRALRGDANTNIISTPSIMTLDNEEAEIKIAQEVPFITGQYTNTSGSTTGSATGTVNPFQTIQRQEVGTILKITPQINDGGTVLMKIEQEASSLAQGTSGAVDLITNKRTINTKVLVDDGGVIVLGGLIEDNLREGENRVPFLGAIPLLGELFKTRSVKKVKTNLMVFIRPTIIRDGIEAAFETNSKYNLIRDQQLKRGNGNVRMLPGDNQPTLAPIEEFSRYPPAAPTGDAPAAGQNTTNEGTRALPTPVAVPAPTPEAPAAAPPASRGGPR